MSATRHPSSLPEGWAFGPLVLEEARVLRSWAAQEGWNPGLHDLEVAYALQSPATSSALSSPARWRRGESCSST